LLGEEFINVVDFIAKGFEVEVLLLKNLLSCSFAAIMIFLDVLEKNFIYFLLDVNNHRFKFGLLNFPWPITSTESYFGDNWCRTFLCVV
jgi:hypothetical protein